MNPTMSPIQNSKLYSFNYRKGRKKMEESVVMVHVNYCIATFVMPAHHKVCSFYNGLLYIKKIFNNTGNFKQKTQSHMIKCFD